MAFNLSELLSGVNIDTGNREQIEYISIDRLRNDPNNFYELSDLDSLASNIALCGLQQPIRVRKQDDGGYIILSGHRRRAALEMLINEGREDLRDVPCIVESGEEDSDLTQLKLIMANADTRKISSADQAKQAEQVEKLLYSLQQKGYEFPGRMRDHVAAVCKISTGKLATLKKIQTNLIPQLRTLWESGKLNQATAEVLAGAVPFRQKLIWEKKVGDGNKPYTLTADWAASILREMDNAEKHASQITCMERPKCDHVNVRVSAAADLGRWQGLRCYSCCCTCHELASCKFSCPDAFRDKQRLKDDAKAEQQAAKAAKEAEEAPKRNLLAEGYSRLGKLMERVNVDTETYVVTSTGYRMLGEVDKVNKLIAGGKVQLNNRMPGGIWPDEAEKLGKTADLLGCTIDYLLCHSDKPQPTGWQTGTPTAPGFYIALVSFGGRAYPHEIEWRDGGWWSKGQALKDIGTVVSWIAGPEVG